jgi:hypothetical protein
LRGERRGPVDRQGAALGMACRATRRAVHRAASTTSPNAGAVQPRPGIEANSARV